MYPANDYLRILGKGAKKNPVKNLVFCQIVGGVGWGVDKKPDFLLDFVGTFPLYNNL